MDEVLNINASGMVFFRCIHLICPLALQHSHAPSMYGVSSCSVEVGSWMLLHDTWQPLVGETLRTLAPIRPQVSHRDDLGPIKSEVLRTHPARPAPPPFTRISNNESLHSGHQCIRSDFDRPGFLLGWKVAGPMQHSCGLGCMNRATASFNTLTGQCWIINLAHFKTLGFHSPNENQKKLHELSGRKMSTGKATFIWTSPHCTGPTSSIS